MTVIGIDGPSGVGKSSVSREVAQRLGYGYLDTGAMYRAMAWLCLNRGVEDPQDVVEQVRGVDLEISTDPADRSVVVDGVDVTEEIRSEEVSQNVQLVSAVPEARADLIEMQRRIIARTTPGIVAEGRDITTVVAPDAPVRILMTAREDVRIARRATELHGGADAQSTAATRSQIADRDAKDSKTTSFLSAADGVTTLDTSDIDFPTVVEAVLDLVRKAEAK
ncbi:(d)CMP kinase [Brevibacterium sp. 91QC2O2]|jgi:cytidylate kinase|uniref:(d)CMP kinase n=1 Tax=Brevibacterium sp. 91QC2O2 TaxID=2968458 RepID=UPI00211C0BFC|nr:(d)CMP kinase [Brevibacterium sp. 91QC2O2]MCQ9368971.1 (d)CMP kinase [Brevibacterium sp. 91QC2O2]